MAVTFCSNDDKETIDILIVGRLGGGNSDKLEAYLQSSIFNDNSADERQSPTITYYAFAILQAT